jgi:hypothetical protein
MQPRAAGRKLFCLILLTAKPIVPFLKNFSVRLHTFSSQSVKPCIHKAYHSIREQEKGQSAYHADGACGQIQRTTRAQRVESIPDLLPKIQTNEKFRARQ